MPSPLAYIYSSLDSVKRQLFDVLTNPVANAEKSIAYGKERLDNFSAKMYEADTKSVLVGKEQKDRAKAQTVDAMTNLLAGNAGIIVPASAASAVQRASSAIYKQPVSGENVLSISDAGRRIDRDVLIPSKAERGAVEILPGLTPYDVLNKIGDLPPDLQTLLQNIEIVPLSGKPIGSGYLDVRSSKLGLAPGKSQKDLTSTLLHEIQHSAQYLYDMPNGGSPRDFYRDFGKFNTAQTLVEQRLKELGVSPAAPMPPMYSLPKELAATRARYLSDPDSMRFTANRLRSVEMSAYGNYRSLAGETEARAVQQRFEMGDDTSPIERIMEQVGSPTSTVFPRTDIPTKLVDTDPALQDVLNLILGVPPTTYQLSRPSAVGVKP